MSKSRFCLLKEESDGDMVQKLCFSLTNFPHVVLGRGVIRLRSVARGVIGQNGSERERERERERAASSLGGRAAIHKGAFASGDTEDKQSTPALILDSSCSNQ